MTRPTIGSVPDCSGGAIVATVKGRGMSETDMKKLIAELSRDEWTANDRSPGSRRRERRYQKFLALLSAGSRVIDAAKASGLSRSAIYKRRESDPWFREVMEDVMEGGSVRCSHCGGVIA